MANSELVELVYGELKSELNKLSIQINQTRRVERAEIADSIPAYLLADAPLAADGGLGDGTAGGYITLAWISNGRKSGEGAGLGTGILAYYNSSANSWFGVRSEAAVTT
jgi:hypothetical protein